MRGPAKENIGAVRCGGEHRGYPLAGAALARGCGRTKIEEKRRQQKACRDEPIAHALSPQRRVFGGAL